jgi:hypothetical protein
MDVPLSGIYSPPSLLNNHPWRPKRRQERIPLRDHQLSSWYTHEPTGAPSEGAWGGGSTGYERVVLKGRIWPET